MCGLAGRFNARGLADAGSWHARADTLLAHRGPDGAGHFRDHRTEFVHRRLALLDRSPTGAQPMVNARGTIHLVFNGEIYNHRALRTELVGRGHRFRGTSDTEVVLEMYDAFGSDCLERLRGIFAIALYDSGRERVVLARDRFGVKPLYHAGPGADGEWLFASEMKAILARGTVPVHLDRQACYDFLGLGFVPEPATGFTHIAALAPGTCLTLDAAGARTHTFAAPVPRPDPARRLADVVDECQTRLLAAVESQVVADVPVGALLSGGIDSALVVAAHARVSRTPIDTFSVGFASPAHDESRAARAIAEHCGTRHHAITSSRSAMTTDEVLALLVHFDQPFADRSCLPTSWVSQAIREQGIVCALAGDGGDEAFGGYPRMWQAPRLHAVGRAPAWGRTALRLGGKALATVAANRGRQVVKATHLADAARADSAVLIAGMTGYLNETEKAALVAPDARAGLQGVERHFPAGDQPLARDVEELSARLTAAMFRLSLPGDMLRKVDMMSMRHGVEVRVPLLDEDLVALGLSIPHRLKTDGRRGKLVLRALARRWLPDAVADGPKLGFSAPLEDLTPPGFHTALGDLLTGPAARTRGIVDPALVEAWLTRFAAADAHKLPAWSDAGRTVRRSGIAQRLFTLLALELWMREHALSW